MSSPESVTLADIFNELRAMREEIKRFAVAIRQETRKELPSMLDEKIAAAPASPVRIEPPSPSDTDCSTHDHTHQLDDPEFPAANNATQHAHSPHEKPETPPIAPKDDPQEPAASLASSLQSFVASLEFFKAFDGVFFGHTLKAAESVFEGLLAAVVSVPSFAPLKFFPFDNG